MAKPKIPNQKSKYKALNARLNKYTLLAQAAVATFITEVVNSLYMVDYDGTEAFSFDSNPITKGQLAEKRSNFISRMFGLFLTGTALEWAESNKVQDTVADKVLAAYGGKKIDSYYQDNKEKLAAFQSRVYSGRTTYERLGEIADTMQKEVETAISVCGGSSVPVVQTKVEQYFSDVDSLRKDFKQKFGYEPHVQDSQYQASRLLRSEINMAYRTAEQERWMQMDFVVGYEIKRSATHTERVPKGDVCDTLAGKYPKWFKWSGWHPACLCYAIPILKTEDEFFNDIPSENEVTDAPESMYDWLDRNNEYIERCKTNGTLPYWIKDNERYLRFRTFYGSADGYSSELSPLILNAKPSSVILSALQKENLIEIASHKGIEIGEPMSIVDALAGTNPLYGKDQQAKMNCSLSVVTYLARRRGLNVTASFIDINEKESLAYKVALRSGTSLPYIDPVTNQKPSAVKVWGNLKESKNPLLEVTKAAESATAQPGTYQISFTRRDGKYGHRMIVERFDDGSSLLVCPQSNMAYLDWQDLIAKWDIGYLDREMEVIRIDNVLFNPNVFNDLVLKR